MVDIECNGSHCLNATDILQLIKADIPVLNDVRFQLVGEANMSDEVLTSLTRDNHYLSRLKPFGLAMVVQLIAQATCQTPLLAMSATA